MIDFTQNKTLTTAQDKARSGQKLNRAEIKALRIEADRLQDLALLLGCPKPRLNHLTEKALRETR